MPTHHHANGTVAARQRIPVPEAPRLCLPDHLPGTIGEPRLIDPRTETLVINPRLAALVPPPTPEEWATTVADIMAFGIRDFLFFSAETREILDGMHRWPLAQSEGLRFYARAVHGLDEDGRAEWVKKNNLSKKGLSEVAKSDLRGRIYNARKQKSAGRPKSGERSHGKTFNATASQVASECGCSFQTIKRDGHFAREMDKIEVNCGAEARVLLLRADLKFSMPFLLDLAADTPEAHRGFVELVRKEGRAARAAREEREDEPRTITLVRQLSRLADGLKKRLSADELVELRRMLAPASEA
jgi:hypothetical protein